MYGKILRGDGKLNIFVLKRFYDKVICFVVGFEKYYNWFKENKVDFSLGYFFRFVLELGCVLD